jgi:HEPN domain-containing protein
VQAVELEKISNELGLKTSEWAAQSLSQAAHTMTKASLLYPISHTATTTLLRELHTVLFIHVTDDIHRYANQELPFGKLVAECFPLCSEDIDEAHQCFAFGQYTATAFHISRAMENAVRTVAKRMRVSAPRDEWQAYINAMDEAIKKMPFKTAKDKAKRSLYSEASNYLFNFKEAFRNKTMHPKKTYTRREALRVIESAGDFLQYVAKHLFRGRTAKP